MHAAHDVWLDPDFDVGGALVEVVVELAAPDVALPGVVDEVVVDPEASEVDGLVVAGADVVVELEVPPADAPGCCFEVLGEPEPARGEPPPHAASTTAATSTPASTRVARLHRRPAESGSTL